MLNPYDCLVNPPYPPFSKGGIFGENRLTERSTAPRSTLRSMGGYQTSASDHSPSGL